MAANALERADEYARLPRERADAPPGWPAGGRVAFEAVSLAYAGAPDAPALRGVSFAVDGGERLGVCGRTGAGKSSLVAALFRLAEPGGGGSPTATPRAR
ncbi:ATPase [Aureococcus anophagefferens]|nr:ATPase [Aureococcus anophagefferens]